MSLHAVWIALSRITRSVSLVRTITRRCRVCESVSLRMLSGCSIVSQRVRLLSFLLFSIRLRRHESLQRIWMANAVPFCNNAKARLLDESTPRLLFAFSCAPPASTRIRAGPKKLFVRLWPRVHGPVSSSAILARLFACHSKAPPPARPPLGPTAAATLPPLQWPIC